MSTDPSPWAEPAGIFDEEPLGSTVEQAEEFKQETAERKREEARNQHLWETYAHRLTARGDLVR